jgi:hypothetical protein
VKYIGIDNGVSGSIAILDTIINSVQYYQTPTKSEQSYTKTKQKITRIDVNGLRKVLEYCNSDNSKCLIERPMVNPGRFKATASAIRALEATLIVLEELEIPYQYIDSKEWQKVLLPSGLKGDDLKDASLDIAKRLFPSIKPKKDGDGLLIAEYLRRKELTPENKKEEPIKWAK